MPKRTTLPGLEPLKKSTMSPRPAPSGKGTPVNPRQTSQAYADRFARDVDDRGDIPLPQAGGSAQRERLLEIVKLHDRMNREKDPTRKAAIKAAIGELETLEALSNHAMTTTFSKAGNGGDISLAAERAGVSARGDLEALASRISGKPKGKLGGKPSKKKVARGIVTAAEEFGAVTAARDANDVALDVEKTAKALRKAKDPLERQRLGEDATLARLKAFHNLAGAPSAIAAIERQRAGGSASVAKSSTGEVANLQAQLDALTSKLEKSTEPTTRAELDQERRDLAGQLLLERLRDAHRRMVI